MVKLNEKANILIKYFVEGVILQIKPVKFFRLNQPKLAKISA